MTDSHKLYRMRLFPERTRLAIRAAALIAAYPGRFDLRTLAEELTQEGFPVGKSRMRNLLGQMTYIFGELMEDADGDLHWYEPESEDIGDNRD